MIAPDAWDDEAKELLPAFEEEAVPALLGRAQALARAAHGTTITYSPKVFIPLTRLCRDVCHYCTFATVPKKGFRAYLSPEQVREIAARGVAAGCVEALFTIGEAPEERYEAARQELAELGHDSTNAYCAAMAAMVQREFGLLAHVNAGVMSAEDLARFRTASVSQGLMVESVSTRLTERGQVHFGSPGKAPAARLATIAAAGELRIPFTTGILIGIGETRSERLAALLAIRHLHARYGHIQEVIVQNFLPKPGTRSQALPAPTFEDLLWTTAVARIVLPKDVHLQVPPNLSFDRFGDLLDSGIDDWGGISPVTPDHVNPEAPWPAVETLRAATRAAGLELAARTPVYPAWHDDTWLDASTRVLLRRNVDGAGLARDGDWSPGVAARPPHAPMPALNLRAPAVDSAIEAAFRGDRLDQPAIAMLLAVRGGGVRAILDAADAMRARDSGEAVTYVVNRNINYTNICKYSCGFCAFSKGKTHDHLRGRPYDLSLEEIGRRVAEAWSRGATEVCMQGGIHPRFTGQDYLDILRVAKQAAPDIHVHAFSPLEVAHGAATLAMSVPHFIGSLRDAGLGSLPGTAAEILSDPVRAVICPDKLSTAEWLAVAAAAHDSGVPTTATMMFGHVETYADVAAHLLAVRDLQAETGGFTEFVPLPFVHAEAPLFLKGKTRRGPTWHETLLTHAVARLVLSPVIPNIQASWVKLGAAGVAYCLEAGVNDVGGTLMNESISRAAGAGHGEEMPPSRMEEIAQSVHRYARQRTTLYETPPSQQSARSYTADGLAPLQLTAPRRREALMSRAGE